MSIRVVKLFKNGVQNSVFSCAASYFDLQMVYFT